jgi:hypothetical protein
LTEELTQRISGSGEDSIRVAARTADRLNASGTPPEAVLRALHERGQAAYRDLRHYPRWWPADPLAFPYDDAVDVPMGVLDQAVRMPELVFFGTIWMLRDVVGPIVKRNLRLMPEVLAIAWTSLGRGDADATPFIAELDPAMLEAANPVAHLSALAGQLDDPWHRARTLLRIAELFADGRAEALAGATRAGEKISDPVRPPSRRGSRSRCSRAQQIFPGRPTTPPGSGRGDSWRARRRRTRWRRFSAPRRAC